MHTTPSHALCLQLAFLVLLSLLNLTHARLVLQPPLEDRGDKLKFGQSTCVSADGRRVFIGANGFATFRGALYAYTLAQGSGSRLEHWRRARLVPNDTVSAEKRQPRELRAVARGSGFGFACAASADGDFVVVGAPGHEMQRGGVYVFGVGGNGWEERGKLELRGGRNGDNFGWAVNVGEMCARVAVSAKGRRANNGEVQVYRCGEGCEACVLEQSIAPPDYTDTVGPRGIRIRNNFGVSMAMNGEADILAVGCTGYDEERGAVYVFLRGRGGGNWTLSQRLESANAQMFGFFGFKVSMDRAGRVLVVGADGEDDYRGAAYVFHNTANEGAEAVFKHVQSLRAGKRTEEDNFGGSVAVSGDGRGLMIGAPGANIGHGKDHGIMYMYEEVRGRHSSKWKLSETLKLPSHHAQPANFYGWAIGLSGNGQRFVATAPDSNGGAGLATIGQFKITGRRVADPMSLADDDVVNNGKQEL